MVTSTINPTLPASGSPLVSADVRNNFLAAYNDITAILNTGAPIPDDAIQIVTAAGTINILDTTRMLIFNKAVASDTPCNLPDIAVRADKLWLYVFDFSGMANDVTMTPFGTQKIMGATTPKLVFSSAGVVQSGGACLLFPLRGTPGLSGWMLK